MRTETSAAPLVVFRFGFGLIMLLSIIRFWANGWIEKLYLSPDFFFSYRYFEWVKPLGTWTYALFAVVALAAACIMVGYRYRAAMVVFFLGFTYIELMDKTTYLNHYYFISLLAFLLIWIPIPPGLAAARGCRVNRFYIHILRLFVAVVYFYAGLAKLNSDWLLHAQPLAIWLPARYDLPFLGDLLQQRWVHFAFAWGGALYDLAIPFLLLWRRTRVAAFLLVVIFHVLTRVLFPIGMFPYIMIVSALIFFGPELHERILAVLARGRSWVAGRRSLSARVPVWRLLPITGVLLFHLLFPFRYVLQPGELFWTEAGYRFSWRVMLMEKAGLATFRVEDGASDRRAVVDNREFLTAFQEKQMATQPDFLLEFAQFIAREYQNRGFLQPQVYVDSYVALNGRRSQPYVDPELDLTTVSRNTPVQQWLLPFQDTIYGF
ncbi:HTTM domain-containing protein [Neolewinella litorea]|uniref:HTTM domain-containing protein n=1 Tax=Neolewinella litorea TaxID=2562452 RepID=A0A4S4NRM4_9BACT|nr:HTTM domain-containing protein [Neolewinella litorea]THH41865.1 HTTM domain-containing protein [Neolewinella litorea]